MGGWVRYLQLQAKAKSGLSSALLVWCMVAILALVGTIVFLTIAGFVWLSLRYGELKASLIIAGALFLIALIAALASYAAHRSAVTKAQLALAERKHQPWLDPAMLGMGFQIGRSVGWGRLLSLGAVAVLAAGLGKEWLSGRNKPDDGDSGDGDSED